jgi:hypothetical protein
LNILHIYRCTLQKIKVGERNIKAYESHCTALPLFHEWPGWKQEKIKEEFEDAKVVIRIHKAKKERQDNDQMKKDKQRSTKHFLFGLNSKYINRVPPCVLSNQKYWCLQLHSPENYFVPWRTFWMSNRKKLLNCSEGLHLDHSCEVHLIVFLCVFLEQPLLKVCLVRMKE